MKSSPINSALFQLGVQHQLLCTKKEKGVSEVTGMASKGTIQ